LVFLGGFVRKHRPTLCTECTVWDLNWQIALVSPCAQVSSSLLELCALWEAIARKCRSHRSKHLDQTSRQGDRQAIFGCSTADSAFCSECLCELSNYLPHAMNASGLVVDHSVNLSGSLRYLLCFAIISYRIIIIIAALLITKLQSKSNEKEDN